LAIRLGVKNLTSQDIEQMKSLLIPFKGKNLKRNIRDYTEADKKFHSLVNSLCRKERLIQMIENLQWSFQMLRYQSFRDPYRVKTSLRGHMKIINAMVKGDTKMAEAQLRKNIRLARDYLVKIVSEET